MSTDTTLLVDASSLIYRAFFSTPDSVRGPDGNPVNAAYGFLGMVARLVSDHDPDRIGCATDEDWRPAWRVRLIDTYKTHRTLPGSIQQETDKELALQMPIAFELLRLCGVGVVGHPGFEAEDVIGSLAARAPGPVIIVSGDRDLFQLVRDPDVVVLYPKRGVSVVERVDESYIAEHFGIPGRTYRDYAVLRGDSSDGLPGVRGIGPKMAASLLQRYGSLDAIVSAADAERHGVALSRVRRDSDYIERARRVVTIPTDLPLREHDLERPRRAPAERAFEIARRHGLEGQVRRLVAALVSGGGEAR